MNLTSLKHILTVLVLLCCELAVFAQNSKRKTFPTPEDAVVAAVEAAKAGNTNELMAIFGPAGQNVLSSGDPVMDQRSRDVFLVAYAERAMLKPDGPTRRILYVGNEDWPFPIPVVKDGETWRFDTASGAQEILFRRIGHNELSTIGVCKTFVEAQKEYAATGHDGNPAGRPARKFASTPGRHDGLYWKSDDPEDLSPLGEFAADAASEGYSRSEGQPTPFHGYLFRMLNSPAKSAKNDGFALIAFPAAYGVSGVMTFIVNQRGVVYEKDLGPETAKVSAGITQFEPGSGWERVNPAKSNE